MNLFPAPTKKDIPRLPKSVLFGIVVVTCGIIAAISLLEGTAALPETVAQNDVKGSENQFTLHRQKVLDKANGSMPSHTIYVPEGWKLDGETLWPNPRFFQILPSPRIEVTSPEGFKTTIHQTASFSDPRPSKEYQQAYGLRRPPENSSDGGWMVRYRPDSEREWKSLFKNSVIPQDHPGAKNIHVNKVSEIKKLSKALQQKSTALINQIQQQNSLSRSYGLADSQSIEIKGMMIEAIFEVGGKQFEYVAVLGFFNMETQIQGMTQVLWSVEPNVAFVGPKGKLESKLPILSAVAGSMRPTRPWTRQVQNYVRSIQRRAKPSTGGSKVNVANTYSEILDISHNGFRVRSGMNDAGQSKYVHSVHETNSYSYGGTSYNLPAGYGHVYTNDFDTIILTNDSMFDPNVDTQGTGDWNKMNAR